MMYTEITGFEWDEAKAQRNAQKHGITFRDASDAFQDPVGLLGEDVIHSQSERRQGWIGQSADGRLMVVIFTLRPGRMVRMISARPASRTERKRYEEKRGVSL